MRIASRTSRSTWPRREFFELCRDRLADGGTLVVNVGHPEGQDDLEKVLTATMAEVFPNVLRDPVEDSNTLLVTSESPMDPSRLRRSSARFPSELSTLIEATASRLAPALEGGEVYTDDKAPVEWLIDKSIVDYAASDDD